MQLRFSMNGYAVNTDGYGSFPYVMRILLFKFTSDLAGRTDSSRDTIL